MSVQNQTLSKCVGLLLVRGWSKGLLDKLEDTVCLLMVKKPRS